MFGMETQGGNSSENCSTQGIKKPDLVCTKPGFSILKSGGCHRGRLTQPKLDEFFLKQDSCWLICEERQAFQAVIILRKKVIQPQVPLGLPCYDLSTV